MSMRPRRRQQAQAIEERLREMSSWTVLFHEGIAAKLGLNATDHKCLDLVLKNGAMTAGDLARRSGLTTGAITGVLNRLAKARLARRVTDPRDRRRVVIEPNMGRIMTVVVPLFAGIGRATQRMLADYSAAELDVALRFCEDCIAVVRRQVETPASTRRSRSRDI